MGHGGLLDFAIRFVKRSLVYVGASHVGFLRLVETLLMHGLLPDGSRAVMTCALVRCVVCWGRLRAAFSLSDKRSRFLTSLAD